MALCLVLVSQASGTIVDPKPTKLDNVGIDEKLGDDFPTDIPFIDHNGESVTLGQYFDGERPVILNLVYYNCPMLCNMVLNGFVDVMKAVELEPGRDFQIVTLSINPEEGPELAKAKRDNYLSSLGREGAGDGWVFLTGSEENIRQVAESVGFRYAYDEAIAQYAHAAAIFVLTNDARVSRYLYGINFQPRDLKLALLEASDGKIGTTIDQLILFCYHFDPGSNSYVLFAMNVMRLGGGFTILLLGFLLFPVWFRSYRRSPALTAIEGTNE